MELQLVHNNKVPINHALLQSSMDLIRAAPRQLGLIAGWDPSGGAGMLADLATAQALQVRSLGLVSSLTAQSLQHWSAAQPVDCAVLKEQMACLQRDPVPASWKIGALGSAENSQALAQWLSTQQPRAAIVIDPVLRSSSAGLLGTSAWLEPWVPLTPLLCPNTAEWEQLQAELPALRQCPYLITDTPAGAQLHQPGAAPITFEYRRRSGEWRGTGCTLATLIAIGRSANLDIVQSCGFALAQLQAWLAGSTPPHIQRSTEAGP